MAKQNSFDIVSKVDLAEVKNAVNQAMKEITQRYDLKNTDSGIEFNENERKLVVTSRDKPTLERVDEVLCQKLAKRKVSLKALQYDKVEPAAKDTVRQAITFQQGIPTDKAKEIVKLIKRAKLKVQAAIQDDLVRVSGKDRDSLQEAIALVKGEDFGIDMQFTNYRSQ